MQLPLTSTFKKLARTCSTNLKGAHVGLSTLRPILTHFDARRIINLDREVSFVARLDVTSLILIRASSKLRNFANAARQLGSSVGILSSSFHLRERLTQILYLFRENASDLFPRKVQRRERETVMNTIRPRRKAKALPHGITPSLMDDLDAEDFPEQLEKFAHDVVAFLDCLNEFPEFTDEAVNAAIIGLEGDLKVNSVVISCVLMLTCAIVLGFVFEDLRR